MNEITVAPQQALTTGQELGAIMRAATDPAMDPERARKLLELYQEMAALQARQQFDADLHECQRRMPAVVKDRQITGRNKYATLEHIERTIRPIYQEFGFTPSYDTQASPRDNEMIVVATFGHRSQHRETRQMAVPYDASGGKNPIQARGSAFSYGRRYLLCQFFNIIIAEEDTNGNAPEYLSTDQAISLRDLLRESGGNEAKFAAIYGVATIEEIPAKMYAAARGVLDQRRGAVKR